MKKIILFFLPLSSQVLKTFVFTIFFSMTISLVFSQSKKFEKQHFILKDDFRKSIKNPNNAIQNIEKIVILIQNELSKTKDQKVSGILNYYLKCAKYTRAMIYFDLGNFSVCKEELSKYSEQSLLKNEVNSNFYYYYPESPKFIGLHSTTNLWLWYCVMGYSEVFLRKNEDGVVFFDKLIKSIENEWDKTLKEYKGRYDDNFFRNEKGYYVPNLSNAYACRADAYRILDKLEKTILDCNSGLKILDDNAGIGGERRPYGILYYNRAGANKKLGNIQRACKDMNIAKSFNYNVTEKELKEVCKD
ncbi:MAG: hypothetical protein EAZ06_08045 [Cytophagales bacterium]|nr:MAG: hypothetical protein EAZ06_08045 [Cytophagales bacterium]